MASNRVQNAHNIQFGNIQIISFVAHPNFVFVGTDDHVDHSVHLVVLQASQVDRAEEQKGCLPSKVMKSR